VFDLTDLELDGVDTVDDDLSLANLRTIVGLHLRNAKAGTRSCSGNMCLCLCPCGPGTHLCLGNEPEPSGTK
jgi:hypothetical protein